MNKYLCFMKKILYVASNDFNKYGGGRQAVRAYLDSVLEIFGGEYVDVLSGTEYVPLEEYKDLNYIKYSKRSRFISYKEVLLKGYLERWSTAILNHLKTHLSEYEMIIINGGANGSVIPQLKKLGLKVATIHHNEEVEYTMDNKSMTTFGGRWDYLIRKAQKLAYKYSDVNLFLTFQDRDSLEKMYGNNCKINEVLGVYDYKSAYKIIPSLKKRPFYQISISGSLSDYQTVHGIMDINKNYFDIIDSEIPGFKMLLTGRNPSYEVLDFANNHKGNVEIVANPIDILSVVQKGIIYLCPTDIGGGLKLRVMDGLKSGMPILVHAISARGYEMFKEKPYFRVYSDRESFKQGLLDLLLYIQNSSAISYKQICEDFYSFFSYEIGTERMRRFLLSKQ